MDKYGWTERNARTGREHAGWEVGTKGMGREHELQKNSSGRRQQIGQGWMRKRGHSLSNVSRRYFSYIHKILFLAIWSTRKPFGIFVRVL